MTSRALECTRLLYRKLQGQLPIVGVGGIMSAQDAFDRIAAGASLLQVYTAFVYDGPQLVHDIVGGLDKRLGEAGVQRITERVGRDV